MNRMLFFLAFLFLGSSYAQQMPGRILFIPDIKEYKTLKCDFHMHTVFSDGLVWPTIRVEEAWMEGLDAIAITDHIEYMPHRKDVNPDLGRPYELAKTMADRCGIILIRSLEITRSMPPGHLNALFLGEPDSLKKQEYIDALYAAKAQDAFVFWNHPGWIAQAPDGIKWYDTHTELLDKDLFSGIEVVNHYSFYPEALDWCLEKNLTILGNSDIHGTLSSFLQGGSVDHRPMTLVFATERSAEGIRDALINRRTAVWFRDLIIGSESLLDPLFRNCLETSIVSVGEKSSVFKLNNVSDLEISFRIKGSDPLYVIPPRSMIIIQTNPESKSLEVVVNNFITGKDRFLSSELIPR